MEFDEWFKKNRLDKIVKLIDINPDDLPEDITLLKKGLHEAWHASRAEQWLSVEDRLPDINRDTGYSDSILVYYPFEPFIECSRYWTEDGIHWWEFERVLRHDITHWMPLPEPPEAVGEVEGA